tara:strand:+ start:2666 stop:3730 length:1065 start_codon:yes stop_codon:yes gene_type:complete
MAFKIKPPFKVNNTPIYNYPMDEEGVLGKANNNGTILINQNLSSEEAKEVEEHEMGHIDQMKRGDLDYDDQNVYWKGKVYPRSKMQEGAHNLPWEKEIYDKKEKKEDMGFKLDGYKGNKSPFKMMMDKGLITPLNANGNDKKNIRKDENLVKDEKTSTKIQQGEWDVSQATIDAMQKKLNEKAKETGKYQEATLSAKKGGLDSYDKVWRENRQGVQDKYDSYEDFAKAAEDWWKSKEKKLVASPPPEKLKVPSSAKIGGPGTSVKTTDHKASVGKKVELIYDPETETTKRVVVDAPEIDYQSTEHGKGLTDADAEYRIGPDKTILSDQDITGGEDVLDVDISESNIPGSFYDQN